MQLAPSHHGHVEVERGSARVIFLLPPTQNIYEEVDQFLENLGFSLLMIVQ